MYCACWCDLDLIHGQGQGHWLSQFLQTALFYVYLLRHFSVELKTDALITTVWDLVYSYSEPDFLISPPVGDHVTLQFVKCWYHQNPLGFISALPAARSLWLWLQVGRNKPCTLAAMTVSPLDGAFLFKYSSENNILKNLKFAHFLTRLQTKNNLARLLPHGP